jgi:hypothetical protein
VLLLWVVGRASNVLCQPSLNTIFSSEFDSDFKLQGQGKGKGQGKGQGQGQGKEGKGKEARMNKL